MPKFTKEQINVLREAWRATRLARTLFQDIGDAESQVIATSRLLWAEREIASMITYATNGGK